MICFEKLLFAPLFLAAFVNTQDVKKINIFGEVVKIPPPTGFVDAKLIPETGPLLDQILKGIEMEATRTEQILVSETLAGELLKDSQSKILQFLAVRLYKSPGEAKITKENFSKLASFASSMQTQGMKELMDNIKFDLKHLDEAGVDTKELAAALKNRSTIPLGVFAKEGRYFCISALSAFRSNDGEQRNRAVRAFATASIFINNRIVMIDAHSEYRTSESLKWVRSTIVDWAEQICRVNPESINIYENIFKPLDFENQRRTDQSKNSERNTLRFIGVLVGFVILFIVVNWNRTKKNSSQASANNAKSSSERIDSNDTNPKTDNQDKHSSFNEDTYNSSSEIRERQIDTCRERSLAILGLGTNATDDEIKSAYRKIVKFVHPDRHATQSEDDKIQAAEQFKRATEAYKYLIVN